MLEDVSAHGAPDRPCLACRLEVLQQIQIRHARSAGNDDGHGNGVDDLGKRVDRSSPVALDDVGPELDAQPSASLQVRNSPGRGEVFSAVIRVRVLRLGDERHPPPAAGFTEGRRHGNDLRLVLGRERNQGDDCVGTELERALNAGRQNLLVRLAPAAGCGADLDCHSEGGGCRYVADRLNQARGQEHTVRAAARSCLDDAYRLLESRQNLRGARAVGAREHDARPSLCVHEAAKAQALSDTQWITSTSLVSSRPESTRNSDSTLTT
jgi:hypothetical protein